MASSIPVKGDDDDAFLALFEQCELPEEQWTHMAHVRVAWICLGKFPPELALQRIRNGIQRYNAKVLARSHQYHETVTVAFTRIVASRMVAGERWPQFAVRIQDVLNADEAILLRYYSSARLFSAAARHEFLEPDLQDLPSLFGR